MAELQASDWQDGPVPARVTIKEYSPGWTALASFGKLVGWTLILAVVCGAWFVHSTGRWKTGAQVKADDKTEERSYQLATLRTNNDKEVAIRKVDADQAVGVATANGNERLAEAEKHDAALREQVKFFVPPTPPAPAQPPTVVIWPQPQRPQGCCVANPGVRVGPIGQPTQRAFAVPNFQFQQHRFFVNPAAAQMAACSNPNVGGNASCFPVRSYGGGVGSPGSMGGDPNANGKEGSNCFAALLAQLPCSLKENLVNSRYYPNFGRCRVLASQIY